MFIQTFSREFTRAEKWRPYITFEPVSESHLVVIDKAPLFG